MKSLLFVGRNLPVCADYGLGVTVWGPLAGGWLSGRAAPTESSRAARFPDRWNVSVPANAAKLRAVDALAEVAAQAGLSLIHLALAFVLEHPVVTSALIGPRTLSHLDSQLGAADVRLGTDVLGGCARARASIPDESGRRGGRFRPEKSPSLGTGRDGKGRDGTGMIGSRVG